MKTLDEVITGLDICKNFSYCTHPQKGECPYLQEDNSCSQDDLYRDALYYLKDMKNLAEDYDILYNKYWREYNQQQANPALTWDELKQMERKPVWVEYNLHLNDKKLQDESKAWDIIDHFGIFMDNPVFFTEKGFLFEKEKQGEQWQTYRKERECLVV